MCTFFPREGVLGMCSFQAALAHFPSSSVDEPILSFQRNAFHPLKEERKLLDPKRNGRKAIDLLYHEVCQSSSSCIVLSCPTVHVASKRG